MPKIKITNTKDGTPEGFGKLFGLLGLEFFIALILWATYNNLPLREAFGHLAYWPSLGIVVIVNWLTHRLKFGGKD